MNEALAELIRQAMTGDKVSFGKLVSRYKQHIVNIVFGIIGKPHDAEEIAQEAFLYLPNGLQFWWQSLALKKEPQ